MSNRPSRCAYCKKTLKFGPRSPKNKKFCSPKCRVESFWLAKISAQLARGRAA